jgi:hypothetical protein
VAVRSVTLTARKTTAVFARESRILD